VSATTSELYAKITVKSVLNAIFWVLPLAAIFGAIKIGLNAMQHPALAVAMFACLMASFIGTSALIIWILGPGERKDQSRAPSAFRATTLPVTVYSRRSPR
jgi:hypothetical protein